MKKDSSSCCSALRRWFSRLSDHPQECLTAVRGSPLEVRSLQTRAFETKDEVALLSAGIAVLQDMGYTHRGDQQDGEIGDGVEN